MANTTLNSKKFGTLDLSNAALVNKIGGTGVTGMSLDSGNTFKPASTYGLDMDIGGKRYMFLSEDLFNAAVKPTKNDVAGTVVFTPALDRNWLDQLVQKSEVVDLKNASLKSGKDTTKNVSDIMGYSTKGVLLPYAEEPKFGGIDAKSFYNPPSFTDAVQKTLGINATQWPRWTEGDAQVVNYLGTPAYQVAPDTKGGPATYVTATGDSFFPPTVERKSNNLFGGFVGDILGGVGDLVNDLGPVGKLAMLAAAVESGGLTSLLGAGAEAGAAADLAALADVGMGTNTSLLGAGALGLASDLPDAINALGGEGATAFPVTAPTVLEGTALPALTTDTGITALSPDAGALGSASDLATTTLPTTGGIDALLSDAGSLGAASDLPSTLPETVATPPTPTGGITDIVTNPSDTGLTTTPDTTPVSPASPVPNVTGTGDPGSAPIDNTSTLPGANAGAPGSSYTTTPGGGIADITGVAPDVAAGASPGIFKTISDATGIPEDVLKTIGTGLGVSAAGSAISNMLKPQTVTNQYGSYTGPLANFSYNPSTYTPYTYKPFAGGGAVEQMSNANAVGANTGFPMANIQRGAYATPYQQPISQNVITGDQDTRVDPYTGEELLATGGIAALGDYSDGGRLLRGPGDGVSDSIPAVIGGKQPARLADGEFVIPARIVSELGNGSTDAGARKLYAMMDKIQAARRKTTGKDQVAKNTRADKYLPT